MEETVRRDASAPATAPAGGGSVARALPLGERLVQEGLITREQLAAALLTLGDEHPGHPLLGQTLVEQKVLTHPQLAQFLERHGRPRLGEVLLATRAITPEQLAFALEQQERSELRLGDLFVKLNFVTEKEMKQALCAQLSIPFVDLDNLVIDRTLAEVVDAEYARARGIIPVATIGNALTIAMDDPTDQGAIEGLATTTGRTVQVVTSTRAAFRRALERMYGQDLAASVAAAERIEFLAAAEAGDVLVSPPSGEGIQRADEMVRQLIALALRWRASDIHLETVENRVRTRFRIDGVLQELNLGALEEGIDRHQREIMSRLRILGGMNIADRRRPQDGSFRVRLPEEGEFIKVNFRASIIPGYFGESAVLRVLDPRNMPRWVQQLGFSKPLLDRLLELLGRMSGLFLITGPTGCGKSTTLYTLLRTIARPEIRILTAEDPIEYVFEHFSQFEVDEKVGTTYASYLRAFLHHDPEVIMLGEILDQVAAEMAFRAAQTGHLLLTTLHTSDAVSSIARLVDLQVPRNLVASSLLGVLSQRLVRVICSQCREEALPPAALLEEFFGDGPPPVAWYRGRGCPRCNFTGYKGRIAVGELWAPSSTDLELITSGATMEEVRASARTSTLAMPEDVYGALVAGRTTLDELKRVLPPHAIADFRRLPERDAPVNPDLVARRPL